MKKHRPSRLLFATAIISTAIAGISAVPAAAQQTAPEIPFDSVPNFLKLPKDLYIGEPSGVAVNSKGHVFVFSRGGTSTGPAFAETAAQLLEFAPDGKYIREIGKNLYAWSFAHAVRIDPHDNIWAVDKGSDMIVKFDPEGHVLLVSGRKQEASDEDTAPLKHPKPPLPAQDGRYRQPTDITWDPQGNSYISDGYINSRVAKLDKDGNWVMQWGSAGSGPGQFATAHSIAADAQGNIYVADRGNRRIQVFDGEGKFLRQITIDLPYPADARMVIGNRFPDPMADNVPSLLKPGAPWVKYIHGDYGKGSWTFLGGHDPEDPQHAIGNPPTDLSLHANSPGYRLILNNVLFPAAKKKPLKT